LVVERTAEAVAIRVSDTGIGMTSEFAGHAFEMFAQADSTRTRADGGLGIGLSLVRAIIEMHGGTVTAHSDGLNRGSEFTVQLPIRPATGSVIEQAVENTGQRRAPRSRRMLIVDDHRDSAQSLAMLLRTMGNVVHTTYDGPSALEAAAIYQPQIVLSDIGLPGMNGYELAKALRKLPGLENVVLVAVTGWGQEEDRQLCLKAGFDHHVVKPIDIETLQKLMAGP
jgi:CheY-like chemotaxis protein